MDKETQATEVDTNIINDDEIKNLPKLYYSIGEVAKMFNANQSQIRYWEQEFNCIKVQRNAKGNRLYTKEDIQMLKKIHYLVKDRGMTLEGAKKHLKAHSKNKGVAKFEVIEILQNLKNKILEMKEQLDLAVPAGK